MKLDYGNILDILIILENVYFGGECILQHYHMEYNIGIGELVHLEYKLCF